MSLMTIITRIEQERELNRVLLASLLERLDGEITRVNETKQNLREEFAERDASLLRLIEEPIPAPASAAILTIAEKTDAADAA